MVERGDEFRVLIAGGGVAGLEGALALRELAGDRVAITLITPEADFVYRPMRVKEPFGLEAANRYPVKGIASDIGVELVHDAFKWLDRESRIVHTEAGERLPYDALLIALGARLRPAFKYAVTIDDRVIDEQLHGLIQDVEGGYSRSIAFLAPTDMPWPLPIYELALMTAARAYDMQVELSITIATPEHAPLAIFGTAASDALQRLLDAKGIAMLGPAHCSVPEPGKVLVNPGQRTFTVDRIVALPQLFGPSVPGLPTGTSSGFVHVDAHCRVRGMQDIFAAGDAVDFPIKHGGIAAQQADTAAMAIAALAGATVDPKPFNPDIHGILLGGDKPLYLSAHIIGGRASSSRVTEQPTWSPPSKIVAKYLGPYLESHERHVAR